MGWRFRKSINLGFGFRINLSKSGIGYSWGFPGYRVTKMANGGNRVTYSIPGTGISYVEQSGSRKQNNQEESKLITGETETFKNIPIENIQKNDEILKKINTARLLNKLSNWLIILSGFMTVSMWFVVLPIMGVLLKLYISRAYKIGLYYEFDDTSRKMYNSMKEALIELSQSYKLWQVRSSTDVYNTKYNAGAGKNVLRNRAFITSRLPWYLKTNVEVFGFNLRREKLIFTPDRILIFRPFKKVFGCTYRDLNIKIFPTRFVEDEKVQRDSNVIDYTWKYVNKNGSRDLRFSRNKQYPVCQYGEIVFKSPNGINTDILISNYNLIEKVRSNILIFGNTFNEILSNSEAAKGDN